MSGLPLQVEGYACLGRMTTALMLECFASPDDADVRRRLQSDILANSQRWDGYLM
jgi:hypothetical protein